MCCAPIVYMFVYILIGAHMVHLTINNYVCAVVLVYEHIVVQKLKYYRRYILKTSGKSAVKTPVDNTYNFLQLMCVLYITISGITGLSICKI